MTETEAIITNLAKMPCPVCSSGRVYAQQDEHSSCECSSCGGTGALVPWLRKECPDCRSFLTGRPTGRVNPHWRNSPLCNLCHGTGWLPRLDIPAWEALARLPVYERLLLLDHWRRPLWEADSITAEDVRLAFWQAVEKAVSP